MKTLTDPDLHVSGFSLTSKGLIVSLYACHCATCLSPEKILTSWSSAVVLLAVGTTRSTHSITVPSASGSGAMRNLSSTVPVGKSPADTVNFSRSSSER